MCLLSYAENVTYCEHVSTAHWIPNQSGWLDPTDLRTVSSSVAIECAVGYAPSLSGGVFRKCNASARAQGTWELADKDGVLRPEAECTRK